ncbi:hypothetical protein AB3331_11125 [Streptococcus sp. H49]|uniref:hypothetical protein n=1 Tax=Streptococcus huangxiaojuni TaxID=3237239 RepID=UPI0034A3BD47
MDYLRIRQRYTLLVRLAILLPSLPLLYYLFAKDNYLIKILCVIIYMAVLAVCVYIINRWYSQTVTHVLYSQVDLAAFRQFIEINGESKNDKNHLQSKLAAITYHYLIGDFVSVIQRVSELDGNAKLSQSQARVLALYRIKSHILLGDYSNKQEFRGAVSKTLSEDHNENREIVENCEAVYDIVSSQQPNDYFEELESDLKIYQLELMYFKACNTVLKGNTAEAEKLFTALSQEDDNLYIVKESKKYLEEN